MGPWRSRRGPFSFSQPFFLAGRATIRSSLARIVGRLICPSRTFLGRF
jgi:hypothetical protein